MTKVITFLPTSSTIQFNRTFLQDLISLAIIDELFGLDYLELPVEKNFNPDSMISDYRNLKENKR